MSVEPTPTIATHVPVTVPLEAESLDLAVGRPDIPPPSLWQQSVQVSHKVTKRIAVVARVDWSMNMFRAFYPDEGEINPETGKPVGRFADRTEWQHCRDWDVSVTFSPRELARQQARTLLDAEIAKLDSRGLAAVSVLCDDDDPAKALAKLEALRQLGVVKASSEVASAALEEMRVEPKKGR